MRAVPASTPATPSEPWSELLNYIFSKKSVIYISNLASAMQDE
jgi:hypothetical protein